MDHMNQIIHSIEGLSEHIVERYVSEYFEYREGANESESDQLEIVIACAAMFVAEEVLCSRYDDDWSWLRFTVSDTVRTNCQTIERYAK